MILPPYGECSLLAVMSHLRPALIHYKVLFTFAFLKVQISSERYSDVPRPFPGEIEFPVAKGLLRFGQEAV